MRYEYPESLCVRGHRTRETGKDYSLQALLRNGIITFNLPLGNKLSNAYSIYCPAMCLCAFHRCLIEYLKKPRFNHCNAHFANQKKMMLRDGSHNFSANGKWALVNSAF